MRHVRSLALALAAVSAFAGGLLSTAAPAFAAAPEVKGESVSSITPFEARLEATVDAGEETTECHFEYGKTSVTEHEVKCEQETLEGGEQGVGATVTALTPKALYHYRVLVKNATSEATGSEEAFTTLTLEKPTIESQSASSVTASAATLEALVDPDYQATTYTFEYATNKALAGAKTKSDSAPLEGAGGQLASVAVSGLEPGEVYYYRVVAKNGTGTTTAATVQSFATVPTPVTEAPASITGVGAILKGHFALDPLATKYSFDYKLGSACAGESSTPTVEAGTGASDVEASWEVPSAEKPEFGLAAPWSAPPLDPNREYTVCLVTSNTYGSQVGSAVHFKTSPAPPAIDSESAVGVGVAGIALQAKINPNMQETSYFFEYGTSRAKLEAGEGTKVDGAPPASPLPAELAELPVTAKVGAPQPQTTYYYRALAENESTLKEGKPAAGEIESYALPVVVTDEAKNVTQTSATLSGIVNPESAETTYYFAYIDQAGYEQAVAGNAEEKADPYAQGEVTSTLAAGSSSEPQTISPTPISGLLPGHTYHYALVAANAIGREIGPDETFTTPEPTLPIVSVAAASAITQNTATLSGTVDTNGLQTHYGFEIGTEPANYGPATGLGSIGGSATEAVSVTLGELQPATTYYYRVTATNADGTSYSEPETFTTLGFPSLLTAPTSPPLLNIAAPAPPKQETTVAHKKTLTKAQKLAKALKACKRDRKKSTRSACEARARKQFGAAKKKTKK